MLPFGPVGKIIVATKIADRIADRVDQRRRPDQVVVNNTTNVAVATSQSQSQAQPQSSAQEERSSGIIFQLSATVREIPQTLHNRVDDLKQKIEETKETLADAKKSQEETIQLIETSQKVAKTAFYAGIAVIGVGLYTILTNNWAPATVFAGGVISFIGSNGHKVLENAKDIVNHPIQYVSLPSKTLNKEKVAAQLGKDNNFPDWTINLIASNLPA